MRAILRTLRRANSDEGLSLSELLVSIMVTSIALAMVTALFVNVVKVTGVSNATTQRSSSAANVINEISTVIRPATDIAIANSTPMPAVDAATGLTLTIYSFVDTVPNSPAPSKVSFSIDSNRNLVESRIAGTLSAGYWVFTATPKTRTLPGPLQRLSGDNALFVYLDATNTVLIPGTDGLTAAQRDAVASIKVNVTIANNGLVSSTDVNGSDPVTIVNTFGMPNLITGKK